MPSRRCFVSLDLPDEVLGVVVDMQNALRSKYPELRYTQAANLHLTLKFLGETQEEQVQQVKQRLDRMDHMPFMVRLVAGGCFPPRILWLALEGADELQQLIDTALEPIFPPEHRFMGHVTIARAKVISDALRHDLESLKVPSLSREVTSFSLKESHLTPEGPRYETISRYEL